MYSRSTSVPRSISAGSMNTIKSPRRRPEFPGSLTDLHRYRKTVHGHDGDSRIIMVRKTDERTYASIENGKEPLLETVTRETVETFRGQRTELRVTTERKEKNEKVPPDLLEALGENYKKINRTTKTSSEIHTKMDFQREFLKAHNDLRAKHGVAPLKLNDKISKLSQIHAEKMLRIGELNHSGNSEYGENLFFMWSSDSSFNVIAHEALRKWYAEIDMYTFGEEPKHLSAGHFTQVVWKESKELGVGLAKSKGSVFVVANYYPRGNVKGYYTKNVFPPRETNNNNELARSFNKLDVSDRSRKSTPTHSSNSYRSVVDGTEGNFEEDFLKAHNDYRARHGVPPLKLDRKISKYAEEWAKMLAVKNVLEHRKNNPYGENIYMMYSSDPNFKITGNSPVDAWYDEIKYHTFGREPSSLKSGHFTQVVWKSSELVGVGVAKSKQGSIYVVANYSPPGNFVGSYAQNVPPLISSSSEDTLSYNHTDTLDSQIVRSVNITTGKFTQFQVDALKAHNELRRKHGVPDLILDRELCDFAQEWADYCLRHDLGLRSNNPYGENLLTVTSSDSKRVPDARDVVDSWYREISKHDFNKESINYDTLHFSQIVWKGTRELGIGVAQNERGKAVIVANYSPRGNVYGQFKTNVFRPKV